VGRLQEPWEAIYPRGAVRRQGLRIVLVATLAATAVIGVLAVAGVFRAGLKAPSPRTPVTVTVNPAQVQGRIPPGFLGLSVEYWAVETYAGRNPAAINPVFVQLVRNLMPGQQGSLRIGGVTTDHTWWPVAGVRHSPGLWYKLNLPRLEVMRALADATDTRLILGITFEADNRKLARAEGQAMLSAIGPSRIAAFELGNEPELYGDPYFGWYTRNGQNVTGRSADYDMSLFTRDFANISSVLPTVPLAGPAVGAANWLTGLNQFILGVPRLGMITVHRYPFEACSVNPASPSFPTVSRMLSPLGTVDQAQGVIPWVRVAHAHGLPIRIGEMNNVACGSVPGIDNTFMMALWVVDALYADAQVGVDGVNIHTWPGAIYNLFSFKKHRGLWHAKAVEPEYYGLLMFAQGEPPGSHLVATSSTNGAVRVWATQAADGTTRVTLINDDTKYRHRVEIEVKGATGAATLERLLARSATASSGVTFGGQSFAATTTGLPAGPLVAPLVTPRAGRYSVVLPPASAGLLTVR
jgi:hypothetical protein